MAPEDLNLLSLPAILAVDFVLGPVLLRRAGYPWGKTVFGSLTGLMVLLAAWGVLFNLQNRAGIAAWPLGWLVPLLGAGLAWRFRGRLKEFSPE